MISCLAILWAPQEGLGVGRVWPESGLLFFSMDFCTLQRTTHKVGEDEEDEKRAGASVWKKERLCLMNSRPMSNGTRGCLALDDRHLEGGGKVVGHSQCRGSVM